MGKKKGKKFNKKEGQQYVVVHRSQQDPLYGDKNATDYVLAPMNTKAYEAMEDQVRTFFFTFLYFFVIHTHTHTHTFKQKQKRSESNTNKSQSSKQSRRLPGDKVDEMGLPIDGYDYTQHLKVIDGSGTFIGPNGKVSDPLINVFNKIVHTSDEPMIDRSKQLEAIALDTKAMPKDMRMALDGDVEGNFETLNDDFVVEASKKTQDSENNEAKKVFDFKAYYASIMKEDDDDDDDEEEFDDEMIPETKRLENRLLDAHFDAVIKRYEDEDIGELDEEDPRVQDGLNSMENNEVLEDALADFEEFNKTLLDEDRTDELKEKKNDDVSNAIASAMSKVSGKSLMGIDEDESSSDEEDEEEDEDDNDDLRTHSWFERKEKAQWDCETILSTYSNLDNRPTTIAMKEARQGIHRIRLSKKTGLPLAPKRSKKRKEKSEADDNDAIAQALQSIQSGAVVSNDNDEEFESLVLNDDQNTNNKRDKNETKAEKRERKRRVKAERRARRAQKKEMKNAFKKAENLVKRHEVSDKTSGRTVRRYE